jgi:hypothetical protein
MNNTIYNQMAGNYSGTYSGMDIGTWTVTVTSAGSVSGGSSSTAGNGSGTLSGSFGGGTIFSGTDSTGATWTGVWDTSKNPPVLSGTWVNGSYSGTWTGTKQ